MSVINHFLLVTFTKDVNTHTQSFQKIKLCNEEKIMDKQQKLRNNNKKATNNEQKVTTSK